MGKKNHKKAIESLEKRIIEHKNKIKSEHTFVIIETSKEEKITIPEGLTLFREKVYGKTKILFLN